MGHRKVTLASGVEVTLRPLGMGAAVALNVREHELTEKYGSKDIASQQRNLELICNCLVSPRVSATPDGQHPYIDDVLSAADALEIIKSINEDAEAAQAQVDPLSATAT